MFFCFVLFCLRLSINILYFLFIFVFFFFLSLFFLFLSLLVSHTHFVIMKTNICKQAIQGMSCPVAKSMDAMLIISLPSNIEKRYGWTAWIKSSTIPDLIKIEIKCLLLSNTNEPISRQRYQHHHNWITSTTVWACVYFSPLHEAVTWRDDVDLKMKMDK